MSERQSLTYRDAGVDIDAGNALVERIKPAVRTTLRPEVLSGLGGFGGLFEMPAGYRQPVLVAGTDGVGTKLKLALQMGRHDGVGVDLVAMCVNDVIVPGAEPLFFLDYYATGQLDVDIAAAVVEGIALGCRQAGAALIGGETAELPGMYHDGDYDLAGFCVGVVEREEIIDGSRVAPGDVILGLASSGPHSNGFSLIRRILDHSGADAAQPGGGTWGNGTLAETLLAPTRIYVKPVLELLKQVPVSALAHITGGGLPENLPRVLPDGMRAVIDTASWDWPPVFGWLAEAGNVATQEMYRTFNCGMGMALLVPAQRAGDALAILEEAGETAWVAGRVEAGDRDVVLAG